MGETAHRIWFYGIILVLWTVCGFVWLDAFIDADVSIVIILLSFVGFIAGFLVLGGLAVMSYMVHKGKIT